MTTWALVIVPPVFVTPSIHALIWAEPKYLRERAGHFVPLSFGAWVAFGELSVWLGHVSAG